MSLNGTPIVDPNAVVGDRMLAALNLILDTYTALGVEPPERRYISIGDVAVECEQLTIQLVQLFPGTIGQDPAQVLDCIEGTPYVLSYAVEVFRRQPNSEQTRGSARPHLVSSDALTDATLVLLKDAWVFGQSLRAISASAWGSGITADITPITTEGQYAGLRMNVSQPL